MGQPTAKIPVLVASMPPPPSVASTTASTLAVDDEITEARDAPMDNEEMHDIGSE